MSSIIFLALSVAFLVGAFCALYLRQQLRAARAESTELRRQGQAHQVFQREVSDVLYSVRNLFDHLPSYIEMDPNLSGLLAYVSGDMVRVSEQVVPTLLNWDGVGRPPRLPYLHEQDIGQLVAAINDPVLKNLWESRSLCDSSEMLRHSFFLAFGYPHAVAFSTLRGVNISYPGSTADSRIEGTGQVPANRLGAMWSRWARMSQKQAPYVQPLQE